MGLVGAARALFSSLKLHGGRIGRNISAWFRRLPFMRTRVPILKNSFTRHDNLFGDGETYFFKWNRSPYSAVSLIMGMAILSIANNGNLILTGQLPFDEYENATFKCKFPTFEDTNEPVISVLSNGRLSINGTEISDCQFRKVNFPFLFMEIWDGVIELKKNVKTKFHFFENAMDRKVPVEFSQIVNTGEDITVDFDSFLQYNVDLGSTTEFMIDKGPNGSVDKIRLKFTVDNLDSFDFEMKANETFEDDGYPMIGSYQFENEQISVLFNLRREHVPFYIVTHGIIDFKQPKRSIKSIIFATDGKEMRFQGQPALEGQEEEGKAGSSLPGQITTGLSNSANWPVSRTLLSFVPSIMAVHQWMK